MIRNHFKDKMITYKRKEYKMCKNDLMKNPYNNMDVSVPLHWLCRSTCQKYIES